MDKSKKLIKRRLRYYFEYVRYFFKIEHTSNPKINSPMNTMLVVSHEMTRTGAPLLLLHIVKKLHEMGWDVIVVSRTAGPLVDEFRKYSRIFISKHPIGFKNQLKNIKSQGVKYAFVNSVISGKWVSELKEHSFQVVSLVHEMPQVIEAWRAHSSALNMAKNSDVLVFPSDYVRKKFSSVVGVNFNSRVKTQGLYLHNSFVIEKKIATDQLKIKYSLPEKPIVINVATGNYRKGFDLFVDVARLDPACTYIWVGDVDRALLGLVEKQGSIENISNLVLLGYLKDINLLTTIYSAASVLCLTSREEPFGSIVLEAMNQGTPVVGFIGAGGFQDVVRDNETGMLVEYENINEMRSAIHSILNNIDNIDYYNNTKMIAKKHNFDSYVQELLCMHEEYRDSSKKVR
ncbi:glycosyltransferase family 4 protein [Vibrio natriegens]|uniref:glycosyltransferase family 4 protein n=1 Tax=Vibrio natriegens TaxID=691 RepID=UPI001428AAEF|nr:glycosyltransferase family 4 protein [Vibrio natriegens]